MDFVYQWMVDLQKFFDDPTRPHQIPTIKAAVAVHELWKYVDSGKIGFGVDNMHAVYSKRFSMPKWFVEGKLKQF